jgi:8-oxo-dGTP pyrophosphatase MutT (NUDIX family)
VTRCQECGYDWTASPHEAVAVIGGLPDRLSHLLLDLDVGDDDSRLRTRPAPDAWSPLEYIAHTGDAVAWYSARVHRIVTEDQPVLEAFEWDTHTATQRYHQRHLGDVLADVNAGCAGFVDELASFGDADWLLEGTGSDGEPRTIAELASRAAHEAHHHLRDIELGIAGPERHAIAVVALVRSGQILLVHRHPERRWYPDCWDLVGGHIEPGESPGDAARRECMEEVGAQINALQPMSIGSSDPTLDMHAFLATDWTGEPANLAPEEHDDLRWFGRDEIPSLVLADPASLPAILAVLDD